MLCPTSPRQHIVALFVGAHESDITAVSRGPPSRKFDVQFWGGLHRGRAALSALWHGPHHKPKARQGGWLWRNSTMTLWACWARAAPAYPPLEPWSATTRVGACPTVSAPERSGTLCGSASKPQNSRPAPATTARGLRRMAAQWHEVYVGSDRREAVAGAKRRKCRGAGKCTREATPCHGGLWSTHSSGSMSCCPIGSQDLSGGPSAHGHDSP